MFTDDRLQRGMAMRPRPIGTALDGKANPKRRLAETRQQAANVLASIAAAFANTRGRFRTGDDIVHRAHVLILDAIGTGFCSGTP